MMKRFVFLFASLMAISTFAEKLPAPVKLEVMKGHLYDFSKKALANSDSYFTDEFAKGNTFSFDGETLIFSTKDGNVTNNMVNTFVKTETKDDKTWQYIITLDSKGDFPTIVEIKFLPNNDANILFPLMDGESGDFFGLVVSECKVIP